MFSMMKDEKKLILFEHSFLHLVYDGARERIYSFITLIFLCFLSWSMRKNSFWYNFIFCKRKNSLLCKIIFCMLSMMEQKKKVMLLKHYFFYVVYDEERDKTCSFLSLLHEYFLWISKRKNSVCYQIIFCLLSMI